MPQTQQIKKTLLTLIPIAVVVGALGLVYPSTSPKIAYVNIQKLLHGYQGMQEAKNNFDKQKQLMLANVDTLQRELEQQYKLLQEKEEQSTETNQVRYHQFKQQELQFQNYAQGISEKIAAEDARMMESVLNQVNSFVEQYAQKEGYDIILGTDGTGNVLYGKKDLDITEELLKAINQAYTGDSGTRE